MALLSLYELALMYPCAVKAYSPPTFALKSPSFVWATPLLAVNPVLTSLVQLVQVPVCSVAGLCPTPCDPMDYIACQGPLVHRIFQARMLEWVAISSSRGSSWSRCQTCISCNSWIGSQILFSLSHGNPLQFSCLENLIDGGP